MKYFKYFEFNDIGVEVIAFKEDADEGFYSIKFIAIGSLGNIEATPSYEEESVRDEAWENNVPSIARSFAIMVNEAFVEG